MLAENLNIETVAEGLETVEQLEFLQDLNGTYIQGYLLAKPLDARAVKKVMMSFQKEQFNNRKKLIKNVLVTG